MLTVHETLHTRLNKTPDSQTVKTFPKLTFAETEALRQEALERFFPSIDFVAGSDNGGLRLAHSGALAVAICTGRMQRPSIYLGPRVKQFTQIAQAQLAYLVLCGVVCDEAMVEQERVFFAVPLKCRGEDAYLMDDHPLQRVSKGGHYNVQMFKRASGWELSLGGGDVISLAGCDRTIGTVFVPAHLRRAPRSI